MTALAEPMAIGAQAAELRRKLFGSWKMLSWTVEDLVTGEKALALGESPAGSIIYTPDGRVMVLVLRSERPSPAELLPTEAEKVALYDSMFAYAGTYTIDQDRVSHHIDMSWNQAWTGTTQVRLLRLEGDRLTYTSVPARNPMTGRDCVHHVAFTRVAAGDGGDGCVSP